MFDKFVNRHIGCSNPDTLKSMLNTIGVGSIDELISQVIPSDIRLNAPLALSEAMSEYEFAAHIQELAARNQQFRSFIGMGYYPNAVSAAIMRNVFENPAWYTSYTPSDLAGAGSSAFFLLLRLWVGATGFSSAAVSSFLRPRRDLGVSSS